MTRRAVRMPAPHARTCSYRRRVRLHTLALLFVLVSGCGERPRSVQIVDARALYDGTRGDVVGSLLIGGNEAASCTRPWLLPEVVCDVDAVMKFASTLDLELALDIGVVSRSVDLRSLHPGRHLVMLEGQGAILVATVTFEVRLEPFVPWSAALAIAIMLGIGAAVALRLILGARFLSGEHAKPRGIAITCVRIATAIAIVSVVPIAHYAKDQPAIVAIPSLLGTFAAAAIVIDAIGKHRLGSHRLGLLINAVFAAAMFPLIFALLTMSLKWIAVVVAVMVIFLMVS